MSAAVFRVENGVIRCLSCGREEKRWNDRSEARFKAAHAEACPQNRPRL